jgi:DNA-directed RNA polymerase subunit RPC12/RpoP
MALKPITELGPSNPIYPFMLLSQYRILVCQKCEHACLANEVATHLAKKHPEIDPGTRHRLVEDTKVIPNVLQSRVELSQLEYPPPTTEPIPCRAPPKLDVLKCRHCSFKIRQVQAMQEHCAKSHDWVNPRSKGRPPIGHPAADPLPWIEGIACQRFFTSREGSKWFQVSIQTEGQTDRSKVKQSAKKPQVALKNLTSKASAHLQQVIGREARYREALSQPRATVNDAGTDTFAAMSLWLAVYRQLAARRSYHTYIPRWIWVTDDVFRIKRRSY